MRLPTCPYCGLQVSRDSVTKKDKGKTYHIVCFDNMIAEKYSKKIEEQQDPMEELKSYICQIFEINELSALMNSQIEKMAREYSYTPSGMLFTLKYFYEICENSTQKSRGIGIIPFVYEDAKQFYKLKKASQENTKDIDISDFVKYNTIRIKTTKEDKNIHMIDIQNL